MYSDWIITRLIIFNVLILTMLLGSPPIISAQTESLLYLRIAKKGYAVIDAKTGQEKFSLPILVDKSTAFSPNRTHFYVAEETQITVYDSHTGQLTKTIPLDQSISKDIS